MKIRNIKQLADGYAVVFEDELTALKGALMYTDNEFYEFVMKLWRKTEEKIEKYEWVDMEGLKRRFFRGAFYAASGLVLPPLSFPKDEGSVVGEVARVKSWNDDKEYIIGMSPVGYTCTCEDYIFGGVISPSGKKYCKHVLAVKIYNQWASKNNMELAVAA